MRKKKNKILVYFLSAVIPIIIFAVVATINGYLSGKVPLNPYDAYYQYPGMTLEFARNLKNGNIFYSFKAGLGFNFFGALCYYCMGPLNLLSVFASPSNYPIFIIIMTFIRFGLLGLSMCFYLEHKGYKDQNVVLFSTVFALMGFTSTYFYNFMWIDSIILLPLVIHGLDKILENKSGTFYTVILTLSIISNYYIGYMICIFSLIWFLYKIGSVKEKKTIIKKFFVYSILAGFMSSIVLFPSFFALMTGKATLYKDNFDYFKFSHLGEYVYMLTTGAYGPFSYKDGPALIYSGIISLVLIAFYFTNSKFSKKEKIKTFIILVFFYLSLTFNLLNYAWQFFQKPIWWQGRFSFVISFFLIVLSARTLENIETSRLKRWQKLLIWIVLNALIIIGVFLKYGDIVEAWNLTCVYILLSSILILTMLIIIDRKKSFILICLFTAFDLSMNTFNALTCIKNSAVFKEENSYLKADIPKSLDLIENDNFYRFYSTKSYTVMDGLYLDFNGIDYFNSTRNMKVIDFFRILGAYILSDCYVRLDDYDPLLYSLLNVEYIYGDATDYYEKLEDNLYKNKYPLSIGFVGNSGIKDLELPTEDPFGARESIIQTLTEIEGNLYTSFRKEEFVEEIVDGQKCFSYSFESTDDFFPIYSGAKSFEIDGEEYSEDEHPLLHKGDKVKIVYQYVDDYQKIELHLLNIESFEKHMEVLSKNLLEAHTNLNGHILEGKINVSEENKYLFTTIEYEQGMKIYLDGKLIEPDIVLGTLIGFDIPSGNHTVTIDYIPKGFISGTTFSIIGTTLFIIYKLYNHKSKRKSELKI